MLLAGTYNSGSPTIPAHHHRVAPTRRSCHFLLIAERSLRACGSTRNPLVGRTSLAVARTTRPMTIAIRPVLRRTGFSWTWIQRAHPTLRTAAKLLQWTNATAYRSSDRSGRSSSSYHLPLGRSDTSSKIAETRDERRPLSSDEATRSRGPRKRRAWFPSA